MSRLCSVVGAIQTPALKQKVEAHVGYICCKHRTGEAKAGAARKFKASLNYRRATKDYCFYFEWICAKMKVPFLEDGRNGYW